MSTSTFAPQQATVIREWKSLSTVEQPLSVSAIGSANAHRHRVFQALTVPEYIEAWFSAPDALIGSTTVTGCDGSFSIRYSNPAGQHISISCSYQVVRRSKLLFTWRSDTSPERVPSLVKIRLVGDFERTTVQVTHVGMQQSEQQWHAELWEASLEKLCSLF